MAKSRDITCPHCQAVLALTAVGNEIQVAVKTPGLEVDSDLMASLFGKENDGGENGV